MQKNWHNISSKVQLTGDLLEMTRRCMIHDAAMTPVVAAIADGVGSVDLRNSAM